MTTAQSASLHDSAVNNFVDAQTRERTPWLLAFLCLLIPILPSYSVPAGPLKSNGSPAKLIAIAFFFLSVLGFVLLRRTAKTRTVRPGVLLILLYFMMILIIYGVGLSSKGSALAEADTTRAFIAVLANVGIALYAATRIETVRQRSILLGCLAIGLTFNCVVGVLQNLANIDLHLLLQPPGFVDNQADLGRGVGAALTDRFGAKRAFGTSGHAIEFSVLAAITVPLTIHFARYAANRQVRRLAALAAVIALFAMSAGVSRSGVITLAAAFLVYMWTFKLRDICIAVVVGALAILVEFAAAPGTGEALFKTIANSGSDASVLERVADYAKVSDTFRDHPVFGLGLGRSSPLEYGFLDNEWLQALVQGGGVGFAAMIVLAGGGIFGIAAALRVAASPRERDQAYAMGAMLVGILTSSYTFDLFSYQQATLLFFMLFGLLWSNFTVSPEAETTEAVADLATFG